MDKNQNFNFINGAKRKKHNEIYFLNKSKIWGGGGGGVKKQLENLQSKKKICDSSLMAARTPELAQSKTDLS